jgi:predicted negative regulator of RcsB-dependent stress response
MIRTLLNWMVLPALALGLLSVGTLAPISDLLDKALSWVAVAMLLAYVGVPMWEYHRERQRDQSSSAAISSSDQM